MESSNNNLNALDPNEEHDGKTIDRLDMLGRYQRGCVNPAHSAQGEKDEKDNENANYHSNNNENKNESNSDTKVGGDDKRSIAIGLEKRSSSLRRIKVIFENTYRMEPKQDQYFIWYKVKALIAAVVGPLFTSFVYESKGAANLSKLICSKVLLTVRKKYEWPRYRYICQTTIAQMKQQGLMIGDRCLWNTAFDGCAAYTIETKSAVLVVTFHAIYVE